MISSNLILIFVSFTVAVAAIYALYSIILFQGTAKGEDLQLSTKNILEQVSILFDKREYALVELLASKYLDRVPGHTEVRKVLAKAYLEEKKYNQAIKQCSVILRRKPNDIDTHYVLGKCYKSKGLSNKAINEFYTIYEHDKKNRDVLKLLADLYIETEQFFMAIGAYGELVEITDDNSKLSEYYSVLADLNIEIHDYPAAFEAYKSKLSIYPKDVETNKQLVELYIKISNYPVAIETLLLMLSFVTETKVLTWIFETLVDLYEETEDYEKAIAYAEKLLDINGTDKFKIRNRIAEFNLKIGKTNDGILILEDLALMSQNGFDITVELAQAYINRGDFQKALDRYLLLLDKATQKEAKTVNSLIGELYIKWSIEYTKDHNYTKAMEYLNNAIQYSPINPEIYYNMANNHYEQKNYTNTVEYINKAISYDKEGNFSAKYLLMLSLAHHELGNFFEEKKALSDLLKIDENNAEGLYRLGLMYIVQHDIKNAEEALKKSIRYAPDQILAKYNLALIYENSNRDRAKELYMEILEQDPTFTEAKNALADLSSSDLY